MSFPIFDENYLRSLTEGDAAIEKHFFAYFSELLLIKIRSRVRSPNATEDIRQETFLRVVRMIRKEGAVQHPERLGALVLAVCNNVILEWFRSDARHRTTAEDAPDLPDQTIDLEGALVTEERKRVVQSVMAELPAKDRELLQMAFLEDRDKEQICVRFGVDREYLRVLLHRAKLKFKEHYLKRKVAVG
ncbi:MAG TPA: sigma-70 family RNA polymerase sigma factor [Bryobacteraceae bacterium]|nr:sigma-70 family RNA polymerase sigma factor [Bryobacteraceae bacterium]